MQGIMTAIARGMVARRWMLRHVLRQAPGAIDARDHRGERQYAAVAQPDRLSAALTKPATACRLATLIAADARGIGTGWQQ
jgi:hypothetical protein